MSTTTTTEVSPQRVLQRVILPEAVQTDVIPLYIDGGNATGVHLPTRLDGNAADTIAQATAAQENVATNSAPSKTNHPDVLGRRSAQISSGKTVSFGTYFNAFPASYWRRWTSLQSVTLRVHTEGEGMVVVYKSNARGVIQRVDAAVVAGAMTSEFNLTLAPFGDGGWYWFDLSATKSDVTLVEAEWTGAITPRLGDEGGKATVQITTMNKVQYCIDNIRSLGENLDALGSVKEILIVDQGTEKVSDHPDFEDVVAPLAGKFRIINQGNLGGSGGFARGMYESVNNGSDYVLLLDDDVVVEPESILRMITFADYCKNPTIVGGHMFDMYDRSVLHAFGEVVNPWRTFYDRPHEDMSLGHDLGKMNLRSTHWMHRRVDVDYNGWWMCLIPVEVIRQIGLPLPAFLKWDDAEYCLRAGAAGFPTVSVPGVALWHVSWVGKDDAIDWQAYFHARNRIVAGLLHSGVPEGGTLLRHSRRADIKHFMLMQYYPVALRHRAIRDILSGPAHMRANLPTAMPAARALQKDFPETVVHKETGVPLRTRQGRQVFDPDIKMETIQPKGLPLRWLTLRSLARNWMRAPRNADPATLPEVEFAKADATWWRLDDYDSAIISAADGSGKNIYRRDRTKFRRMLIDSILLHRRLRREWADLSRQYRAAQGRLTSIDEWRKTFEGTK